MRWRIAAIAALSLGALYWVARTLAVTSAGWLQPVSDTVWSWPGEPAFGGLSGIEVLDGGARVVAISDRAWIFRARVRRDAEGEITGFDNTLAAPIRGHMGTHSERTDAEGLAAVDGEGIYFSTEGLPQIYWMPDWSETTEWVETGDAFRELKAQEGLESLAIDPEGRLVAIPELPPYGGDFPVFRLEDGVFREVFRVWADAYYRAVEADFGPDGHLYLLERRFAPAFGSSTRIRRFVLDAGGVARAETILRTPYGRHGNLEGLSVWRDAQGFLRFTMVSDNDFWRVIPTRVVEYVEIPDSPGAAPPGG